jgi:hypothetical protein
LGDPFVLMMRKGHQEANTYAEGGVTVEDQQILQATVMGKKQTPGTLTTEALADLRVAYGLDHKDIKLPPLGTNLDRTIREVQLVKLAGRPKYRRVVRVGSPWEVNVTDDRSPMERERNPSIAHVGRIFAHTPVPGAEEVIWVQLNWLELQPGEHPAHAIGCPVYKRTDGPEGGKWRRMFSPTTLIRPVHLLHCCNTNCGDGLGGTSGYKATNKEYGGRGRHAVGKDDLFVRNPWFVK